jgi:hypothetical protein
MMAPERCELDSGATSHPRPIASDGIPSASAAHKAWLAPASVIVADDNVPAP